MGTGAELVAPELLGDIAATDIGIGSAGAAGLGTAAGSLAPAVEAGLGAGAAGAIGAGGGGTVPGDAFMPGGLVSGGASNPVAGDAFMPGALAPSEGLGSAGGVALGGALGPAGGSATGSLSTNAQGALGTTGGTPAAQTITPPTAGPTGGAPTAGATGGPGAVSGIQSTVDKILKQMSDNPLGTAGAAIGAANLARKPTAIPNAAQLEGLGTQASGVATQLIQQYQSGTLSAGQQASLDQLTQQTKNQITQYFASIGQSDSTSAKQALAQVDSQAVAMKQQMLDNALQQGLGAIGVAQGPLNTVAQYQLGQDQSLRQAFGSFASAVGNAFGSKAGTTTPAPTTQPQAQTAQPAPAQ